jgi:integrase
MSHRGRVRVIYLSPSAVELLRELVARHPTGVLFRNGKVNPWTRQTWAFSFSRLCKRCGFKVTVYGYRHGYATDLLAAGVPEAHVAELLGHAGTAMLHKHYAHLGTKAAALRAALGRVRG